MTAPLIRLENVDVALDGRTILHGIRWRLMHGEHWAILGGNGSGKSTFLKLIRGELWPAPGSAGRRFYSFDGDEQTSAVGIREKIALVSPEVQGRYLQQEWKLNGLQVIHSGADGGDYVYQRLTGRQLALTDRVARQLGVGHLLERNVQELSTGELRRILIARALAGSPRVLVCDEICDGLDVTARESLLRTLGEVARNGTQLLLTTHRAEEIIPAITHRLVLKRGRVAESGSIRREAISTPAIERVRPPAPSIPRRVARPSSRTLIRIERANVFLGDERRQKQALFDVSLEIRAGEHWAILGPNGAGKSTLLKLIAGDLHPAVGGRVKRFEFTRRNTLWEVKRRIGWVSPELQSNYRERISGAEAIESGFFSSVGLMLRANAGQRRRVARIIDALGLGRLAEQSILQMSYGEFRRILLARALVHDPELLVCDEPFDGLDAASRSEIGAVLERIAQMGKTLVMVTHHGSDLPACVTRVGEMRDGQLVFQGSLEEHRGHAAITVR